ncbi:MAG: hypothetical protein JWO38_1382 [Gemmataceae bacterium]|nr:hypothetical protein [Gemmataceae bacterium]
MARMRRSRNAGKWPGEGLVFDLILTGTVRVGLDKFVVVVKLVDQNGLLRG